MVSMQRGRMISEVTPQPKSNLYNFDGILDIIQEKLDPLMKNTVIKGLTLTANETNTYQTIFQTMAARDPLNIWVTEDSSTNYYSLQSSIADVESNPGSFFYDYINQLLYVHCTDSADPATHNIIVTSPCWGEVGIGEHENISLINGCIAELFLTRVLKEDYRGLKGAGRAALIEGVVITLVPGTQKQHLQAVLQAGDIVESFFENKKCLGMDGVLTDDTTIHESELAYCGCE